MSPQPANAAGKSGSEETRIPFSEEWVLREVNSLALFEPTSHGLPDLLLEQRRGEPDAEFHDRQNLAVSSFVQERLYLTERGRRAPIILIPQQVELIADFFYGRVRKGIVWKNRGGGGTLCASVIAWLTMLYLHFSWVNIAGNAEQAKQGYSYTLQFWECVGEAKAVLDGEPLQSMTKLKDGTYLKCLTNSEKSARSKHPPGMIADEACQDDPRKDRNLNAAMQMVLSNPDYRILVMSTFHVPVGLFQQLWDQAEERGFKKYYWDQFDTLQECGVGLDSADPVDDPDALTFCRNHCPLTLKRRVLDEEGQHIAWKYVGCNGRARHTHGYLPRENAIDALKMNDRETVATEHWCERPSVQGPIYDPEAIDAAYSHGILPELTEAERASPEKVVGIDWGLSGQTAIIGPILKRKGPGDARAKLSVTREAYFTGDSLETITEYLRELRQQCGNFEVFADASHPFNNLHLENSGFGVQQVNFLQWKEFGIKNLRRWFDHRAVEIGADLEELRRCLKAYHRDEHGHAIKKDDHGPDAMLAAFLKWVWEQETQPVEDTGETEVYSYGSDDLKEEQERQEALARAKQVVAEPARERLAEPVTFVLTAGIAWNVRGPSGKTYRFRGLDHPVTVFDPHDVPFLLARCGAGIMVVPGPGGSGAPVAGTRGGDAEENSDGHDSSLA